MVLSGCDARSVHLQVAFVRYSEMRWCHEEIQEVLTRVNKSWAAYVRVRYSDVNVELLLGGRLGPHLGNVF